MLLPFFFFFFFFLLGFLTFPSLSDHRTCILCVNYFVVLSLNPGSMLYKVIEQLHGNDITNHQKYIFYVPLRSWFQTIKLTFPLEGVMSNTSYPPDFCVINGHKKTLVFGINLVTKSSNENYQELTSYDLI